MRDFRSFNCNMYSLLSNMYSEILELGQEVFTIRGTLTNKMKGLVTTAIMTTRVINTDSAKTSRIAIGCWQVSPWLMANGYTDLLR